MCKKGDLLIAMTGATIGKVGLLSENSKIVYLNQRVGKFIPKFEGAELILYCFFMSNTAQNHITNYAGGAAQANISASQIESIKILVDETSGVAPFEIKFSSLVTNNKGNVKYQWDFGDGNTSEGISPSYLYEKSGDYVCTLIVTDEEGKKVEDTLNITIDQNKPPIVVLTLNNTSIVAWRRPKNYKCHRK